MFKKASDNFVIIGTARSKTNLLVSYLNQHDKILCHGELFNKKRIVYTNYPKEIFDRKLTFIVDKKFRDQRPFKYTDEVFAYQKSLEDQIVGFKLLFAQRDELIPYLGKNSYIKKIIPIRNFLFTYSSMVFAQQTQQWFLLKGQERKEHKIVLSPKEFLRNYLWNFNLYITLLKQLQQAGHRYFLLFAEDFPSQSTLADIFTFLEVGMPESLLKEKLIQQNSSNIYERLENAQEIQTLFSGTMMEPFLEADKVPDREFWMRDSLDEKWIKNTRKGIQNLLYQWERYSN